MKTHPELTWEWLMNFHDPFIKNTKMLLELKFSNGTSEKLKKQQEWKEKLNEKLKKQLVLKEKLTTVVSKLREHPELKEYVPMKSINYLRWFPAENCEILLEVEGDTSDYLISIITVKGPLMWETNEEKLVPLDQVADEIYAYITKLRDD